MSELDPDALNKLKVVDLRDHLSSRGLPTNGLKAELVKRLREALLSEEAPSKNSDDSKSPVGEDVDDEETEEETPTQVEEEQQEAYIKANEVARVKAEEEARLKAEEEEAKVRAEKEAKLRAEEDARQKAEEARVKAEKEAKLKAEEETRQKAAEEARMRAEKEAKLKAEEARQRAAEEARQKAAEEAKQKAAEEARLRAEKEAKLRAEEEARQRVAEEVRIKVEVEEEKKKEERRIKRLAEEVERKRAEEIKIREERRKIEEEEMRREQERWLVEEQMRKAQEEHKKRVKAEEEKRRLENEKQRQLIEEQKRIADEKRKLENEKQKQLIEEQKRIADEKRKLENEKQKQLIEEQKRIADEKRKLENEKQLIEEKKRIENERRKLENEKQKQLIDEHRRIAEEKRKLEFEKQKKLAEEQKRIAEEKRILEEEEKLKKERHISIDNSKDSKEELNSLLNILPPPGIPATLHMPPVPHFSPMSSVNILAPPPTVMMSNAAQLLPPGTSIPPTTMQNISAPPTIFPPPMPPVNIMKPHVSSSLIQNNQDTMLNNMQQSSNVELENNTESSELMDTNESPSEIKLPQALEKVLALKNERAQQLGVDPDLVLQSLPTTEEKTVSTKSSVVTLVSVDEDEYIEIDDSDDKRKESRSKRRKKKKKKRQHKTQEKSDHSKHSDKHSRDSVIDVDIEYVQEVIDTSDPLYLQFMKIFEKFKLTDEKENEDGTADGLKNATKEEMFNPMAIRKKPIDLDDDDDDDDDDEGDKLDEEKPKLSKRKLKKLSRMTVAELKQKVNRPELVEMHDVTAKDPVLLLHLKASRNTVPVPRHWCFKRKYLQGKRGIEKPAFELPDFIKRTGIMEMRQALQEKEDQKTMKAKMRERVRPKLGKIDIDYQKLHDAFFKWQTKPKMTIHGDLYYEGKEFETRLKEKKPGDLSEDLRTALGMPTGPNANKCPPPWLIAMQRYGPPPSYPNLKIPGLNAPIPDGCSFGYHAGGWGKPPVDESGRPLYGDVFGTQISDNQPHIQEEEIDHTLWGELESESSEEEEEDEEEEEEDEEEKTEDETGLVTPAEGLITPSGFSSIPAGMETPDMIELRKKKIEAEMEGGETPALYTILPEKKNERIGAAMMGSTHIYDLAAAIPGSKLRAGTTSVQPQGIEVALDPSELEMDSAAMAARYEQTMREQQSQLEKEDLSDMVAEHAARQKNKRKKQQLDSAKPPKKYKEFKF